MGDKVIGGKRVLSLNSFFFFLCRLVTGEVAEGEHVIDKAEGGRTPLGRGMKP